MIKVQGLLSIRGNYEVVLDMKKEEFNKLSLNKQDDEINDAIDWSNFLDNCDVDDIDVDSVENV
jgi:hypothetical protein